MTDSPIKDSGDRTEFSSGAVRDMRKGKGRCDLLPLADVGTVLDDDTFLIELGSFTDACFEAGLDLMAERWWETGDKRRLIDNGTWCSYRYTELAKALSAAAGADYGYDYDMPELAAYILEVSKQFEGGSEKYGENNWKRGIPIGCYIDSAARHHLKVLMGLEDEPHERAQGWNVLCAMWEWAERTGVREAN